MRNTLVVVEGLIPADGYEGNLRDEVWSYALDQRAFGPRRLLVAFADRDGRFLGLTYTKRTKPAEIALGPCIQHLGQPAAAAIAFCDEPVKEGPPPENLESRFALAQSVASSHGVHLVDWIACDDDLFRSSRIALQPGTEWWDVP
jgi:hypothetical protein